MQQTNIYSSKCRCLGGAMLILFMAVQFCLSDVLPAANITFKLLGSWSSMQNVASFEVRDKATLLHEGFVTMGTRTRPPLVLLLVLVEMALCLVGFWALVTPVLFCSFFMGESMNLQRVGIPSYMLTLHLNIVSFVCCPLMWILKF